MNYYNEIDSNAAAWLRELISSGLIPIGDVDTRSITEIKHNELKRYTQCHFFAGIGGWALALKLAGWPATRPVWTGSCPCQPFSLAGKGQGAKDDRHLWPAFFDLIRQSRPKHVFGEQVASAIGHGWLDGISADLEAENYACGAVVLGAHSVCAPHIRQRLYWVADCQRTRLERHAWHGDGINEQGRHETHQAGPIATGCESGGMANGNGGRCQQPNEAERKISIADTCRAWDRFDIVQCRDGKARRFEPESFPLAHGIPGRVGLLRGYGNAIVPQVAAAFINAYCDI